MVVNFGGTHSSHCKEGPLFVYIYVYFPDLVIILWANLAVFSEPGEGAGILIIWYVDFCFIYLPFGPYT